MNKKYFTTSPTTYPFSQKRQPRLPSHAFVVYDAIITLLFFIRTREVIKYVIPPHFVTEYSFGNNEDDCFRNLKSTFLLTQNSASTKEIP